LPAKEDAESPSRWSTSLNKKAYGFGRLEAAFVPTGHEHGVEKRIVARSSNVQDISSAVEAGS